MNLAFHSRRRSLRAFTLAEVMIAMVTLMVVLAAALAGYLYGLRMVQFTRPKLGASDDARKTIAYLTEDVRSAHKIDLGTRSGATFTELPVFSTQVASAMKLYPGTNTNSFIIYYWDGTDKTLKRTTNTSAGTVVATAVTNQMLFTAEDYRGFPYTNENASMIIGVTLQFNQIQFPKTAVGPGYYYDYYQLRAKINKRAYF